MRQQEKEKNSGKPKKRYLWLKIQIALPVLVFCGILLYHKYGATFWNYAETVQKIQEQAKTCAENAAEEDFVVSRRSSAAYAADGSVLAVWRKGNDSYYIPLEEMPQIVIDAMVCVEDKNFYKHQGVDYKALLRACYALVQNRGSITQGGSTITMQLSRNIYLTQDVSWTRKVEEVFLARELEKKFTKDQIMEYYLNNIYFGNGYYGIGNAGRGYFGKELSELTPAQLVYLCAIPNNPTLYDPLVNSENTNSRKLRILEQMKDDGYLSAKEYEAASALVEPVEQEVTSIPMHNYETTYTEYCAVRALMELSGFEFRSSFPGEESREAYEAEYADCYEECRNLLYTEGYRIETSLDTGLQRQLQNSVDRVLFSFREQNEEGIYMMQGAAVCIDNRTGLVSAIVGGRSQDFGYYTLNRAYQSFRQPGSAIKPLIVYIPSFERGYTPDTQVVDEPIPDGPKNATGSYEGRVTLRHAVEQSLNTVAWKLFQELTPQVGLSYLYEMGFSRIVEEDYRPTSALGGFTIGVSPLEMAAGYTAVANDGVFREPTCVVRILAVDGSVLYESGDQEKRVYEQEAADVMEDVLVGVLTKGTGKDAVLENVFCAGKTGTTNEYKDNWFVGYTREYTTSVWVGYDFPREMRGITGAAYAGAIWKGFMRTVYPVEP